MLERLETVPWARLKCLGGFSDHVPAAVRDLVSDDPKIVEAAYWRLENHVVAQGELHEAAAYLPSILIEALDLATCKGAILELLFQIGNGRSAEAPELQRVCHAAVVNGLDRWIAVSPGVEPKWREAAMRDLADLRNSNS
jgi:hypothetical protein